TPLDATRVARLARRARRVLERRGVPLGAVPVTAGDLDVERGWLGAGYGHRTPEAEAAIRVAAADGIELEPGYTGKTMAVLLALRAQGELGDGPLLYWHTHNSLGWRPDPT